MLLFSFKKEKVTKKENACQLILLFGGYMLSFQSAIQSCPFLEVSLPTFFSKSYPILSLFGSFFACFLFKELSYLILFWEVSLSTFFSKKVGASLFTQLRYSLCIRCNIGCPIGMIDNKSGFSACGLFDIFGECVIDRYIISLCF